LILKGRKWPEAGEDRIKRSFVICTLHQGDQVEENGRACSTHGRDEKCIKMLVGKPKVKRPLGRHRRRWGNNIRMGFREIGWEGVDWMHLAQDRDQ
jgi:hypothetical protein